ncbi:hypothetical protein [uncultured Roseibium sp.]|uniref:hypothetical protein n=1 Tax=uncultured Roseibium sp. TaxID=1936171 RepID=UPI003217BCA2
MTKNNIKIRLPLTASAALRLKKVSPSDVLIIHVNHKLDDVDELNHILESTFEEVYFAPLDYRTSETVEPAQLSRIFEKILATEQPYIVLEDGGHWTRFIARNDEIRPPIAHIEQTTKGARIAAELLEKGQLRHQISSIARSVPKIRVENFFIAQRIHMETELLLSTIGETAMFRKCVVIGFGIIGRAVARFMKNMGGDIYVHDKNELILASAAIEGFKQFSEIGFSGMEPVIVFGATGEDISESPVLQTILSSVKRAFLISCSSGSVEYKTWREKNHTNLLETTQIGECYRADGRIIYLLANGRPINFYRKDAESLPICVADLVNATLVGAAATALSSGANFPSLRLIDIDLFEKRGWDGLSMIEKWAQFHGFSGTRIALLSAAEKEVHPNERLLVGGG